MTVDSGEQNNSVVREQCIEQANAADLGEQMAIESVES